MKDALGSGKAGRSGVIFAGVVAVVFGLATIASGGRVLFGGAGPRAEAGNVVAFVLWFNFVAGFLYVLAGAGLLTRRRWSSGLSSLIAAATVVVFAVFLGHVLSGGLYEMRTLGAMVLRSAVWIGIALVARRHLVPA